MSENIRIKTTPGGGESSVNLSINQKFDFIEILSLKISQDEAYRRFCSDYGVVVGRVIVNNGLGVPNAKVSIFIPADEVDLEDPEVSGLYPFETLTDTDSEGISYNLLPRNNRGKDDCFTPIGTFPSKREIQDNPLIGQLHCKYYKFTTTTNESGDFMFFGVPVGTHFMHVNADISDIGFLSQRPYDVIRDGANDKLFKSPTKFKGRKESANLTQLKTVSPMSVTVPPFWGDTEECRIGIARADVDLATYITPSAIFMGSIVSDNDKHALSRTCVPRKKLGKMDELVAGDGRIEMIRKTFDGGIERFDLQDAEIDEDGVWAYQIPMNRDYMVTAEDGTLVPSGDPTKGIPTTARVRFRIGMTTNGDEGRFRTRAKYLVPHNPDTWSDTDFSFDTTTSDKHFRDLSWNKIYTVKNHITRVQARGGAENRNFIGFKNVDDSKNRNPIPFNKLDNDLNPLFTILCILISIIARIVGVINFIIIPLINIIIGLLNGILKAICSLLHNVVGLSICALQFKPNSNSCRSKYCIGKPSGSSCDCNDILDLIPYITLSCSADPNGYEYAPGGRASGGLSSVFTKTAAATESGEDSEGNPYQKTVYFVNDGNPQTACNLAQRIKPEGCDAGWTSCQSLALAESLDVFKFDFYNDWINGTLYPFLLKYKVKKRGTGRERFCEVDCRDFGGGVDNDNNNRPDNPCKNNYIVDTCTKAEPKFSAPAIPVLDKGVNSDERIKIRSGYIKKYENELYYSPITRDKDKKLFATDIVNLGSIFDCDWEGKPKFYQYLTDTTFNIPPLVAEYDTDANDNIILPRQVSGFDSRSATNALGINQILGGDPGLIGNISCIGLNTDTNSCNNLKRFCELGVGLDRLRDGSNPDNKITNQDVESPIVRGIFTSLNTPGSTTINSVLLDSGGATASNYPDYLDSTYTEFRVNGGIRSSNTSWYNENIWFYDNSYYFYFGLNKGKTALTKMKQKYFTECIPEIDQDFFVIATKITSDGISSLPEGAIEIQVVGGVGPYTYIWEGPTIGLVQYPIINNVKNISDLYGGTYTVTVVDSVGNTTEGIFNVPGPTPVSCNSQSTNITQNGLNNGEITVNISNGVGPYTVVLSRFDLTTNGGTPITPPLEIRNSIVSSTLFNNLTPGAYYVEVTDSGTPQTKCQSVLQIDEPQAITVTLTPTDISCNGNNDGKIISNVSGGNGPYIFLWSNGSTTQNINNLSSGSYQLTVTDINGQVSTPVSANINEPTLLTYGSIDITNGNCATPSVKVNNIQGGTQPYTATLVGGDNNTTNTINNISTNDDILFTGLDNGNNNSGSSYLLTITDKNGCSINQDINVYKPATSLLVTLVDNYVINPTNPTITVTINGGIFNSDTNKTNLFSYHIQKQKNTGSGWVNDGSSIDLGVSTIYQYNVTPTTTPTTYRVIVYDKNKDANGCNTASSISSTIVI